LTATAAAIGHNQPPSVMEQIQAELSESQATIIRRRDDLLAGLDRAPESIGNDETAGKMADFIKQLTACTKAAESARVGAKEPHLEASRAVDGFFKKITDPLASAKTKIQQRLDFYLREKAAAEQRRRSEEAAEMERLAKDAADRAQTEAQVTAAIAVEERAGEMRQEAQAKPADMARTRGDFGAVATLRSVWTFEVMDRSKIPADYLMVNEAAIKGAVKAGIREIPGVRIYQEQSAVVR
jgi:hypothetical protein